MAAQTLIEETFKKFEIMLRATEVEREFEIFERLTVQTVSEKIHGCNFSVYYIPGDGERSSSIVYATRTKILGPNESFNGHRNLFTEKAEQRLMQQFPLTNPFLANNNGKNLVYIRLIGELFPTQKGVDYGTAKQFRVFHVEYRLRSDDATANESTKLIHLTWNEVIDICTLINMETVPVIDELSGQNFAEIWNNYDISVQNSRLSTRNDNRWEGICLRIESQDLIFENGTEEKKNSSSKEFRLAKSKGMPLFIKKVTSKFSERQKSGSIPGRNSAVLDMLMSLANPQRVANVASKEEFRKSDHKLLTQKVIADIKVDYPREFQTDPRYIELNDADFERYTTNLVRRLKPFVTDFLNQENN